ncbi:hypothetical protein SprV_0100247000 [Sparganum proliferum]
MPRPRRLDVAKIPQTSTAEALSREIRTCFTTRADGGGSNQWSSLKKPVYGTAKKILVYTQRRRSDRISGRTLQLYAQTARARFRNDDCFRQLRKMTAKSARDDRKQYWAKKATSMEQTSKVGDTRKLYQLIRQVRGNGVEFAPGHRLTDLDYVDDIALLASSFGDLQSMLSRVNEVAKSVGLSMNAGKTKVFSSCIPDQEKAPLRIDGCQLEEVDSFKYLGARLLPNEQSKEDIVSRIDAAHWVFSSLRKCLWIRCDISIATKVRVYRASVRSVPLYGCEWWALRVGDERKLEVFDHHCLRAILRVEFTGFVSNETVRARCDNIARITQAIQEKLLSWFGHVLRRSPEIRAAEERNVWKGDYPRMKNRLQKVNWNAAQGPDPESDWLFFQNIMKHLVESGCPLKRKLSTSRPSSPENLILYLPFHLFANQCLLAPSSSSSSSSSPSSSSPSSLSV